MLEKSHGAGPEKAFAKDNELERKLKAFDSAVVAFSGGVDSTYLLYRAVETIGRERVLALTVDSELTAPDEAADAEEVAGSIQAKHKLIKLSVLTDPELAGNSPERCYICKKHIYSEFLRAAEEHGYQAVLDGSNADDTGQYRPGLRALKELKISSPLLEAGLGKKEVRYLSRQAGLITWDKPSAACLASRLPYGEEITVEKLEKVAAAENYLRQVGISSNLRVRSHGSLARIEVDENDFAILLERRVEIMEKLRELGFVYVTLDLGGFQSGSMDISVD